MKRLGKRGVLEWSPGGPGIYAETHSDDHAFEIEFDAKPYFKKAPDLAIIDLADVDWGGDIPADWVAQFMEKSNKEIRAMFRYLRSEEVRSRRDPPGFEVHVNGKDVLDWIKENRPHLLTHPSIEKWL